jgi:hypothetical protein
MTTDDLRAALDQRPFRPFSLHMPDGRHLAVPTAHFMSIKPGSPLVFVWNLHDSGYCLVNVDQIVRLELEHAPLETTDR